MAKFLAIDPGVVFGWAVFNDKDVLPENFGIFTPHKAGEWLDRCRCSSVTIMTLIDTKQIDHVVCEWPAYRDSGAGRAAAAADSLVKLSIMVGMIVEGCRAGGVEFEPVTVPVWMGQLDDEKLKRRVSRILAEHGLMAGAYPTSHAVDAVGIGFWKKGLI